MIKTWVLGSHKIFATTYVDDGKTYLRMRESCVIGSCCVKLMKQDREVKRLAFTVWGLRAEIEWIEWLAVSVLLCEAYLQGVRGWVVWLTAAVWDRFMGWDRQSFHTTTCISHTHSYSLIEGGALEVFHSLTLALSVGLWVYVFDWVLSVLNG